jgi:hypothetical protein
MNVKVVNKVQDDQVEISMKGIGACADVVNRPSPPRKMVERFLVSSEDEKKPKEFTIENGRGTPLKDIPFK